MPALLNIATNLVLGAGVAIVARNSQAVRKRPLNWALLTLLGFEGVVFTPIATYLFRFYPQWSMLYWFDPQIYPGLDRWLGVISLGVIVFNFLAAAGGFLLTRRGLIENKTWVTLAPFVGALLIAFFVTVFFADRLFWIGDYDVFWQGRADLLFATLPGVLTMALYGACVAFILLIHQRYGRREPRFF